MTKFTLLILFFNLVRLEAQQLDPSIICSAGGSMSNATTKVNWTMGETVVITLHTPNLQLASGFQQTSYKIVGVQNNIYSRNVNLFPNPIRDILTIQIGDTRFKQSSYQLFDVSGNIILTGSINNEVTNINCSQLLPAMYWLKISNSSNQQLQTYKIIKL